MTRRIAIACQGGGSHTAFTAGALKRILEEHMKQYEITALSGTSGGAICALLAWYGLLKDGGKNGDIANKKLASFWKDMSANTFGDMFMNELVVQSARLQDKITIPQTSPYSYPPFGQEYIRTLLEKQVEFNEIKTITDPKIDLLIGAVDAISGDFCVFKNDKISADVILASAAIPTFFRAVTLDKYLFNWNTIPGNDNENKGLFKILKNEFNIDWIEFESQKIDKGEDNVIRIYNETKSISIELNDKKNIAYLKINETETYETETYELTVKTEKDDLNIYYRSNYWDGLFSQNPPIRDLINENIDELWIIQINPRSIKKLPDSVSEISDRRNELTGNLSLYQELYFINKINQWIKEGYFKKPGYKCIDVRIIKNLLPLSHETKLDRSPEFIKKLMNHGYNQADDFLKEVPAFNEQLRNIVY